MCPTKERLAKHFLLFLCYAGKHINKKWHTYVGKIHTAGEISKSFLKTLDLITNTNIGMSKIEEEIALNRERFAKSWRKKHCDWSLGCE